ncbi:hypothetical protein RHSIM_Rhsim09G0157000 [Rhododendron simsii]|uniref:Uncharacterized protein n=1 Tax=Rhododendron simsii TaxID=118357 RepID=A0A834GFW1_RHOSS|nr:hypothetical protein RHSIM_Rhsim09G0157000 [Rhododendron simsii]
MPEPAENDQESSYKLNKKHSSENGFDAIGAEAMPTFGFRALRIFSCLTGKPDFPNCGSCLIGNVHVMSGEMTIQWAHPETKLVKVFWYTNSLISGGMVVPVPFRRWVHVKHRNPQTPHGGFYCLLPIRGQRVIAAVARYRHGGQLEYKDVLGLLSSTTLSFFTDVASISKDLNSEVDQHLPNFRVHTPSLSDIPNAEYR